MSRVYEQLAERILGEMPDLDQAVQRSLEAWPRARKSSGEQRVYLDSVALNLHGLYSALERLFELIARQVDLQLPSGETWHRDLLQQMARDLAEIRPGVISEDSAATLDELRGFRHLVRNIYTVDLRPEKMEALVSGLPGHWSRLRDELIAFADFLIELEATCEEE